MSAMEIRNEIIRENLPQLIKLLTGFEETNENFRHCEQFAWSIIRNHRNLSVNSHEVKRKIEGIQEKFTVGNFPVYSDHLGALCDKVIHHPLCVQHYEVDVHWSLIELLLTLAYNPVGALYKNKEKIDLNLGEFSEESPTNDADYWHNILKDDFIPLEATNFSDSELSDWSDATPTDIYDNLESTSEKRADSSGAKTTSLFTSLYGIKPPAKASHYTLFAGEESEQRLRTNVQHSWWLPSSCSQADVCSTRMEANFCLLYSQFLSETSNNLIKFEKPSTTAEYCLLREIIWMFHSPQTCKFFKVSTEPLLISIQENVSIPSVTVNGISSFLEQHFLPPIRMMDTLKRFIESIYNEDNTPPKTLECYASNLQTVLQPIWEYLIQYESRLLVQEDKDILTLIQMLRDMKTSFNSLEMIYEIHMNVSLNFKQFPAHISSAYLLARLMHCNQIASSTNEANLAVSLFLTSVKVFCIIIDTWWSEGRLDDWQSEFLVERASVSDQSVSVRQFAKNKEKSFFVPTNISKTIMENSFFRLLLDHSLEAGCTLNLLYEINKIGDLRNACGVIEDKLYNVFVDDVLASVKKFKSPTKDEPPDSAKEINELSEKNEEVLDPPPITTNQQQDIIDCLATNDEFLIMAFAYNLNLEDNEAPVNESCRNSTLNALQIFTELGEISTIVLPFEEIILLSLFRILKARIAFANKFLIELYRDDFGIQKHLQNIRKVLLLESSDLMHQFYDNLFGQIESGRSWANPFLLTIQLDGILCSKFPDVSSMFRVEINSAFRCQTTKVCEAVEELVVTYNFIRELSHIITENDLQQYNKVFRFLLKVKWGITTLEKLEFSRSHRRRPPYANFAMIDLIMRRLEQLRFWMIYAIQSIHFHLMTHVLQSMGQQLDEKILNCTNLQEMQMVHKSYVSTVCEHCFLAENYNAIKFGVEQLLNLVFILRLEWNSCIDSIENNSGPLAVVSNDSDNDEDAETERNYVTNSQIDAIELTYIRCHQYLANILNNEVYLKKNTFQVRHKANWFLQILLWLNFYLALAWTLIFGYYVCYNLRTFDTSHAILTIPGYLVVASVEFIRLYLGYSGNLRAQTTDLWLFLALAPLVQLPILLYLTLSAISHIQLISIISCSLLFLMLMEFFSGILTWRNLSYHQAKLNHLWLQMALASIINEPDKSL